MAAMPQYAWLVVMGALWSWLFGYGTGSNDVANAFGTSVGSRALNLRQAVVIAAVFEFVGALVLGRVSTSTIAGGIASINAFSTQPEVYAYGMMIDLLVSGVWNIMASYFELNVSSTHSIIGSILGFALVYGGNGAVRWADPDPSAFPPYKGVVPIILSWFVSPIATALASALLFLASRTFILRRQDPYIKSLYLLPVLVTITAYVSIFFVFTKGAKKSLEKEGSSSWTNAKSAWVSAVIAIGLGMVTAVIGLPLLHRKSKHHFVSRRTGSSLQPQTSDIEAVQITDKAITAESAASSSSQSPAGISPCSSSQHPTSITPCGSSPRGSSPGRSSPRGNSPAGNSPGGSSPEPAGTNVRNSTAHALEPAGPQASVTERPIQDQDKNRGMQVEHHVLTQQERGAMVAAAVARALQHKKDKEEERHAKRKKRLEEEAAEKMRTALAPGASISSTTCPSLAPSPSMSSVMTKAYCVTKKVLLHGTEVDIHEVIEEDPMIAAIHANAEVFDAQAEYAFSHLQVFSAICVVFAHGAGEVGYMAGPLTTIWEVYRNGKLPTSVTAPVWVVVIGAAGLVAGLATYGYKVTRAMGVRLAKLSPTRGFCAELATALVILVCSQYGLPTSSSQCITGGIIGVGAVEGRTGVNWLFFARQFSGWVGTLFIAGFFTAAIFAQGIYAPSKVM